MFISHILKMVPEKGLEPSRGQPSAELKSAASAIPPLRHIENWYGERDSNPQNLSSRPKMSTIASPPR